MASQLMNLHWGTLDRKEGLKVTVRTVVSQGIKVRTVLPKINTRAIKTKMRATKVLVAAEIRNTMTITVVMGILRLNFSGSLGIPIVGVQEARGQ